MNFFASGKFWTLGDLIFTTSQNDQTKFLALKMMERAIKVKKCTFNGKNDMK
jgi:hypothetical protein